LVANQTAAKLHGRAKFLVSSIGWKPNRSLVVFSQEIWFHRNSFLWPVLYGGKKQYSNYYGTLLLSYDFTGNRESTRTSWKLSCGLLCATHRKEETGSQCCTMEGGPPLDWYLPSHQIETAGGNGRMPSLSKWIGWMDEMTRNRGRDLLLQPD
jgi:hypothetical protein